MNNFDSIRPYTPQELAEAMQRIAASEMLPAMARFVFPDKTLDEVRDILRSCTSSSEFQARVMAVFNDEVIRRSTSGFSYSGLEHLDAAHTYLFVSNHRDIVLDASLLSQALHRNGFRTPAITFGSNLMSSQLLVDIGKSNKMFTVLRNDGTREAYRHAMLLSEYIRQTIVRGDDSVWIAQRNGRTKDGCDATEQGLVKMLCMSGGKDLLQAVEELHIVPMAISYEWEPCDLMKAHELRCTRGGEKYVKEPGEDYTSVLTGIMQHKGHVHLALCKPLQHDELLPLLNGATPNIFLKRVADLIDARIYSQYRLHATNFAAHDMRSNTGKYAEKYTSSVREQLAERAAKADSADILLDIYANPVAKCSVREADICVVMPTYNNARTLPQVVADVLAQGLPIVVVNDGSTDGTLEALQPFVSQISIISYRRNRGKGYALRQGFRYAQQKGYRYALSIDTDAQHYASDIPMFVRAAGEHPDAMLVGSRILKHDNMPQKSTFANKFSNFWFRLQTGQALPDTQSGFRLYPLRRMKHLRALTSRYEAELEMLVRCAWRGVTILPVPIRVCYAPKGERTSHYRPVADGIRISIVHTMLTVGALVYGYPRKLLAWLGAKLCKACSAMRTASVNVYSFTVFLFGSIALTVYAACLLGCGRKTDSKKLRYHTVMSRWLRVLLHSIPRVHATFHNACGETFERPSVIICNHQSHLDLACALALSPRIIALTNDWVWRSPLYGALIRYADFYPVSQGIEELLPKLRAMVGKGYSILIFPEGTRSADGAVHRFHRGAFYLANVLNIDLLPVVLRGTGDVLNKKKFSLHKGNIHIEVHPRIAPSRLGATFAEQAKALRQWFNERMKTVNNE